MQRNDTNLTAVINPICPINLRNESMTFVSMPQEDAFTKMNELFKNSNDAPLQLQKSYKTTGLEQFGREYQSDSIKSKNVININLKSFCIVNKKEELMVQTKEDFIAKLGLKSDIKVKVISIFGNTGDGKSHTLNHVFFNGREVFRTSVEQSPCTFGIYCQFDEKNNCLVFDTEGLQGGSSSSDKRLRLLLKILTLSDIVIYRTMAPRLHADMYKFLSDASRVYKKYLNPVLINVAEKCGIGPGYAWDVGPSLIIFHETFTTEPLNLGKSGKDIQKYFQDLKLDLSAFSSLHYIGTRTHSSRGHENKILGNRYIVRKDNRFDSNEFEICESQSESKNEGISNGNCDNHVETNFSLLLDKIETLLREKNRRPMRRLVALFSLLKFLNNRFNGDTPNLKSEPDDYFLCHHQCLVCSKRCRHAVNHTSVDKNKHESEGSNECVYSKQLQNVTYFCRACSVRGRESVVTVKNSSDNSWLTTSWTGYCLECNYCGIIYKSREFWYGNPDPEKSAVQTKMHHVWTDDELPADKQNTARKLLDGLNYVSGVITSTGAAPTKLVSSWIADKIAPAYWESDNEITHCRSCERQFSDLLKIHHCRACGRGFCDPCSDFKRPVPERNWMQPVRVCKTCYESPPPKITDLKTDGSDLVARKIGEAIGDTASVFANIVNYPLGALKDAARPSYWVPDSDITNCACCSRPLDDSNSLTTKHHCRACGLGVCDSCSLARKSVPSRGWENLVRVCDNCVGGC